MKLFTRAARTEYQAQLANEVLPALHDDDNPLPCCGWFDSSHELQTGLRVTEFEQPGEIVNALPLGWWVDWACTGRRSAV